MVFGRLLDWAIDAYVSTKIGNEVKSPETCDYYQLQYRQDGDGRITRRSTYKNHPCIAEKSYQSKTVSEFTYQPRVVTNEALPVLRKPSICLSHKEDVLSCLRIVAISDTHDRHHLLEDLPECDLLIHSGDILMTSRVFTKEFHQAVDKMQEALDFSKAALKEKIEVSKEDENFWLERQEWLVEMEQKLHREQWNKDEILKDVEDLVAAAREAESDWSKERAYYSAQLEKNQQLLAAYEKTIDAARDTAELSGLFLSHPALVIPAGARIREIVGRDFNGLSKNIPARSHPQFETLASVFNKNLKLNTDPKHVDVKSQEPKTENSFLRRAARALATYLAASNLLDFVPKAHASLSTGLVAYYPFDGNGYDRSDNGNNGVVHSATLATDRFGNPNSSYSFNGVSSYIEVGNGSPFNIGNKFSFSLWIKEGSYQVNNAVIFSQSHDSSTGWTIEGTAPNNDFHFFYYVEPNNAFVPC
jgi:ribosome-binding protein aMBF1 (putative translation factor)